MGFHRIFLIYVLLIVLEITHMLSFVTFDGCGPRIGINYGTLGNNLPAPRNTLKLIKKHNFKFVRMFDPNHQILNALRGLKNIDVLVGVKNGDIPSLANNLDAAKSWVNSHIATYKGSVSIAYVVVGNEVIPGPYATQVPKAMLNVKSALKSLGLSNIKVSTTTLYNLNQSFPPSAGAFAPDVAKMMKEVTDVLKQNSSFPTPILVSVYPYYAAVLNPKEVSVEYATFQNRNPIKDGNLEYYNLLDAQIDAYYAALEKIGAGDIKIMVVETGWPTAGNEPYTSTQIAQTYNLNLHKRVMSGKGTPGLPSVPLEVVIFAMFDENLKPQGSENYWGLFSPNMTQKYKFD